MPAECSACAASHAGLGEVPSAGTARPGSVPPSARSLWATLRQRRTQAGPEGLGPGSRGQQVPQLLLPKLPREEPSAQVSVPRLTAARSLGPQAGGLGPPAAWQEGLVGVGLNLTGTSRDQESLSRPSSWQGPLGKSGSRERGQTEDWLWKGPGCPPQNRAQARPSPGRWPETCFHVTGETAPSSELCSSAPAARQEEQGEG